MIFLLSKGTEETSSAITFLICCKLEFLSDNFPRNTWKCTFWPPYLTLIPLFLKGLRIKKHKYESLSSCYIVELWVTFYIKLLHFDRYLTLLLLQCLYFQMYLNILILCLCFISSGIVLNYFTIKALHSHFFYRRLPTT